MRLVNIQQKFGALYGELLDSCDNQAAAAYVALEISKINDCNYCIGMHTEDLAQFTENQIAALDLDKLSSIIEGVVKCYLVENEHYDVALIEYAILVNSLNRIGKLS